MHPTRRNGATERPKIADRFADWLLTHCPLCTLALLTTLVVAWPLGRRWPWPVLVAVISGDLGINVVRWRRRTAGHPPAW